VTTKSGNIFYILIDHRITDGEASVYFLTKVNEFDLLSLLYVPSEDGVENPPPVHPSQTSPVRIPSQPNNHEPQESDFESDYENTSISELPIPTSMIIIFAVTVVFGIGFGIYIFAAGKKKKPQSQNYNNDGEYDDSESWETDEFDE
jgi:hypothetical protein